MSDWIINPVALDLGFIQIHWYGLMYIFSFWVGMGLRSIGLIVDFFQSIEHRCLIF